MIKDVDRKAIHKYIDEKINEEFTGKTFLNWFKGNITNINIGNEPAIWEEKSVKITRR